MLTTLTAKRALSFLKNEGQLDNSDVLEMARFSPPAQARDSFQLVNLSTGGGGGGQTDAQGITSQLAVRSVPEGQPSEGNAATGKIGDPNSTEERIKSLEQGVKGNTEKIKELEPTPTFVQTPDGGYDYTGAVSAGEVVGAGLGGIAGFALGGLKGASLGISAGSFLGKFAPKAPIHLSPEDPPTNYDDYKPIPGPD